MLPVFQAMITGHEDIAAREKHEIEHNPVEDLIGMKYKCLLLHYIIQTRNAMNELL
jgi:hypothetical protein